MNPHDQRSSDFKSDVSTNSTIPAVQNKKRAKDGVRTRDLHLGKVALYQLSYFRLLKRRYLLMSLLQNINAASPPCEILRRRSTPDLSGSYFRLMCIQYLFFTALARLPCKWNANVSKGFKFAICFLINIMLTLLIPWLLLYFLNF